MKHKYEIILSTALEPGVILRATKVALVVGTLLNLINQGEKIVDLSLGEINYAKLFLTFLAPYAVSVYTAISMKLATRSESAAKAVAPETGCI